MTAFDTSFVLVLVSIIFMSITPSSTGHKVTDTEIKHLCSKTNNLGGCYKLLKSDHRTANVDAKGLVEVSVDLASNKANKIHSQLNSFYKATHDSKLKAMYESCSKHYSGAIRDLGVVKSELHSGAYKSILVQVKEVSQEINLCKRVFEGASNDHAHMKKKNQDFEFLLDIVKITSENLKK